MASVLPARSFAAAATVHETTVPTGKLLCGSKMSVVPAAFQYLRPGTVGGVVTSKAASVAVMSMASEKTTMMSVSGATPNALFVGVIIVTVGAVRSALAP